MSRIIERERTIIPALNFDARTNDIIVKGTEGHDVLGGYMLGPMQVLEEGLPQTVQAVRANEPGKPLLYHHWGLGTSSEKYADRVLSILKGAGIDAVVISGIAGANRTRAWISKAFNHGLDVVVEPALPNQDFYNNTTGDESFLGNGYVDLSGVRNMTRVALEKGARTFLLPHESIGTVQFELLPEDELQEELWDADDEHYARKDKKHESELVLSPLAEEAKLAVKSMIVDRDVTVLYRGMHMQLIPDFYAEVTPEKVLEYGLEPCVDMIRNHSPVPIMLDWQTAGTHTPWISSRFVQAVRSAPGSSELSAIRVLPLGGEYAIEQMRSDDLELVIDPFSSDDKYLRSQGGFVLADTPLMILADASIHRADNIAIPIGSAGYAGTVAETVPGASIFVAGFGNTGYSNLEKTIGRPVKGPLHRIVGNALLGRDPEAVRGVMDTFARNMR